MIDNRSLVDSVMCRNGVAAIDRERVCGDVGAVEAVAMACEVLGISERVKSIDVKFHLDSEDVSIIDVAKWLSEEARVEGTE